jgi:divalent metal cation (Fe/Co/Zn/Cd) transporter
LGDGSLKIIISNNFKYNISWSPEDVILMLIIDFKDDIDTEDITEAITRIRTRIKTEFQFIHYVIIQPE